MSSQGSSNPETRINADVLGARSQALGDLLRRTAARKPEKLALVNGELRWSYRELDQAVNRMAASLSRRGLSHGDRLALVSHNSWHYVVLAFATARIGAAAIMAGGLAVSHSPDAGKAIATMCTALVQWFQPDGPTTPEQIAKEYAQFALRLLGYHAA